MKEIKLIYLTYAIGSIYCIGSIIKVFAELIQRKSRISDSIVSRTSVAISIAVLFITIGLEYVTLTTEIPDGEYKINVSVQLDGEDIPYYLPGVLIISTSEDYQEGSAYFGAAEIGTARVTQNRDFYLYKIYWGNRSEEHSVRVEHSVYPETDFEIELNTTTAVVNIGVISPQALGITPLDNWKAASTWHRAEFILVAMSCILLMVQYFVFERKRKDAASSRWNSTQAVKDDSVGEKKLLQHRNFPKIVVVTVLLCVAVAVTSYFIYLGQVRSLQSQADGSYDSGYHAGYEQGYIDGHVEGNKAGYNDGYNFGYNDGHTDGYEQGITAIGGKGFTGDDWSPDIVFGEYPAGEYDATETVYITDTGSKYHQYGCQYLTGSCHAMALDEAVDAGYTPCSRCW